MATKTQTYDPAKAFVFVTPGLKTDTLTLSGEGFFHEPPQPVTKTLPVLGQVTYTRPAINGCSFFLNIPGQPEVHFTQIIQTVWNWQSLRDEFVFGVLGDPSTQLRLSFYKDSAGAPLVDITCAALGIALVGFQPYGANGFLNLSITEEDPGDVQTEPQK